MNRLITFPTWHIFILVILPVIFPSNQIGLLLTALWMVFIGYCFYRLGRKLYEQLPDGHDLKWQRFRFHFFFPVLYILIVFLVFGGGYEINQLNYQDYGWMAAAIIPLHLFAMYCIFYTIWFVAKTISTIEYKKVVTFDLFASNLFLIWFFPIGIWFVFPKIRKILLREESLPTT